MGCKAVSFFYAKGSNQKGLIRFDTRTTNNRKTSFKVIS